MGNKHGDTLTYEKGGDTAAETLIRKMYETRKAKWTSACITVCIILIAVVVVLWVIGHQVWSVICFIGSIFIMYKMIEYADSDLGVLRRKLNEVEQQLNN